MRLTFPDLSGESFRLQWSARQFSRSYDELLRQANGTILFVHPDTIVRPNRIDQVDVLVEDASESAATIGAGGTDGPEALGKAWEIEKAPTQVQLIELLQFAASREYFRSRMRLVVIVSAWDLLSSLGITPTDWISRQLPMLWQFLGSNQEVLDVSCYGLSAQGAQYPSWRFVTGDIKDEGAFARRLWDNPDPVSGWLREQLGEPILTALHARRSACEDSGELQAELVDGLNRVLSASVVYERARFDGVHLRPETEDMRAARVIEKGSETIRLNRLLLEDAYPREISRNHHIDAAMTELQEKPPTRRISLVGPDAAVSHDITEPVQWLMR